ncbi:peptidyl-prolyl cis-trans isomerase D [Yoonia tamlensis]|uniref:Parvulin-like PPIase n=1 Tax=Yoonia tamlensis TaxID=390270 RepID=A0A1I6G625_9RHOB|nr:peptidylprolyl isomerase [Yoonia tamlensis]SFR37634.1 peptidyl-prolyl cis-trans isomerase D [Yoonia tamlensis]
MSEKKKNKVGPLIIVGVVLVGMAGFGSGGFTGNISSLGTVGDKDVPINAYQQQLNQQIQALSQQFGTPVSFQQAVAFGVDRSALQAVIRNRTLDNETAQLGLSVGDQRVFDQLKSIPAFQGAGGFNAESYRLSLQQSGQSEAAFETNLRDEMARVLLQASVVSGLPEMDRFGETLIGFIGEKRSATWAFVDADMLTAPLPAPTETQIQDYYEANPAAFTLPEARDITYVWLTPDMIQGEMEVTDTAIAQLYQDRIAEFMQPERRLVERLVYLDAAKADEARARLDAGEVTFDALVAERGLTLNDVDMGDVDQEELRAAGEAVFAAQAGDVVGPFNSPLGPALFRMNAVLSAQETTLEEATPELRDELAADAARAVISGSADAILDLVAGGATLEDLAERTDLQLGTIRWTTEVAEGIAAYDNFRDAAAAAQTGSFAELLDLADGGVFALRLDGITPPTVQPLDDVRAQAETGAVAQIRQDAVRALAEDMAAQIDPQTAFDTLGLAQESGTDITRTGFVEGTPATFNTTLFEASVGAVNVLDAGDRALILRLDAIAAPDTQDALVAGQIESLAQTATTGIAQDIFAAYAAQLQKDTDVNINQATVNAVNAQFQ